MILGTVAEIHRYPVKSMGGETLLAAPVSFRGLAGDRAYSVFDPLDNKVASAKNSSAFPGLLDLAAKYVSEVATSATLASIQITLPDGRRVRSDDPACFEVLSSWFDRRVELGSVADDEAHRPLAGKYAMAGTFFDYAPLHMITSAAVAATALGSPGSTLDIRRFRPNLLIDSSSHSRYPENEWVGKRLRIGDEVVVEVTDPCPRCVMTTMAQGELPQDPNVLKTIARQNTVYTPVLGGDHPSLGAYAFVREGGMVKTGDPVWMDDERPPKGE